MEIVLMILTLPLMMAGGFLLDGLTHDEDEDEDEDVAATHQPETDEPPII